MSIPLIALFLSPWLLWGMYVLVMGIYRAHLSKRLTAFATALALPWLVIGYALDMLVNLTFASLLFAELPGELLVTSRLQRYVDATAAGWRHRLALWICDHLLDVFDPTGNHC